MDEDKLKFLNAFLEYPEETSVVEYKSAVLFVPKTAFSAKLIKHVLGLANTGGGYIVIGFQEDANGNLVPDPNLTEPVSRSFETTRLSQSVDAFLSPGQRIQLQVHKVQRAGKSYPIISVQGFEDSPYFCNKEYLGTDSKPILRVGAIYVRDVAAKTVVIAGPEHWNAILKRAVAQRQTELVDHFRALLGQMGLAVDSHQAPLTDEDIWFSSEAENARSILRKLKPYGGVFELRHHPIASSLWVQSELVEAAEKSIVRKTGWPMGMVSNNPMQSPKSLGFGVRSIIDAMDIGRFDYWALGTTGHYYFMRLLDEDSDQYGPRRKHRSIYFDTRIWRVAEALLHCSNLYRELGLPPDTQIAISVLHSGLKDRVLGVGNLMRMMHWDRKCEENEIIWSKTVPLGSIEAVLSDLTRDVTSKLFILFEFFKLEENIFAEIFGDFLKSRI